MKGYVDQRVVDLCYCNDIILLSELTYNQLKALSLSTGNAILTYVPDLHEVSCLLYLTVSQMLINNDMNIKFLDKYNIITYAEIQPFSYQISILLLKPLFLDPNGTHCYSKTLDLRLEF